MSCHRVSRATRMFETMQNDTSTSWPLYAAPAAACTGCCVRFGAFATLSISVELALGLHGGSWMLSSSLYRPLPRKDSCSVEWKLPRD